MQNCSLRPHEFDEQTRKFFSEGYYLFETMLLKNGIIDLKDFHFKRIRISLDKLNWPKTVDGHELLFWWENFLLHQAHQKNDLDQRVKLSLIPHFQKNTLTPFIEQKKYCPPKSPIRLCFHPEAVRHSCDPLFSFKLGSRTHMEYFLHKIPPPYDDVIFVNEKKQICETTRHNLYLKKNNQLYTPSKDCGLLEGVMRAKLLSENIVIETSLTRDDWYNANELFISNALVGLLPVQKSNEG